MPFIGEIFSQLKAAADTTVIQEIRGGKLSGVTGAGFLDLIRQARTFFAARGLKKGDRCGVLAANSIRWMALDLAALSEGLIVVPLYFRQAPAELVAIMRDCTPALVCCGDQVLREGVQQNWDTQHNLATTPDYFLFDEIFAGTEGVALDRPQVRDADSVTIIYTSGTSGEAKGVILTAANVGFMLGCTAARLDLLMGGRSERDRIFHYLPFNFCASWIAMLTFLMRGSLVTLNTDLTKIAGDMPTVAPHYFLNVPQLLERMRRGVDEQIARKGGIAQAIYSRGKNAWAAKQTSSLWLALAKAIVFPTIRKKAVGGNLKALICGSAPLTPDTQDYFTMLGIPVLQVYGLTETTGICTMDDPHHVALGRVGPAISGIEMKLADNDEIVVRGPNIFPGYWNRPQQTAEVLRDGWFHTGDQGEIDAAGSWRIVGRIKNLLVLGSGHKIAPETVEEEIGRLLPNAQQVVVVGNGRGYLSAIVTGNVSREEVRAALDAVNPQLPHYKQVRAFSVRPEPFSSENGMLTANGKLKRDLISVRMKAEIEAMYQVKQAV